MVVVPVVRRLLVPLVRPVVPVERRELAPAPPTPLSRVLSSASAATGMNSVTGRYLNFLRRKFRLELGASKSAIKPSTKRISTGRPIRKIRLVLGCAMILIGVSSPAEDDPLAAFAAAFAAAAAAAGNGGAAGLAGLLVVLRTPAVALLFWLWLLKISFRRAARSSTSAKVTSTNLVPTCADGTSMRSFNSTNMRTRGRLPEITTEPALGIAATVPADPNC